MADYLKPLSLNQRRDLRFIVACRKEQERVPIGMLNLSTLRALMRRRLVNIVPTPEGLKLDQEESNG